MSDNDLILVDPSKIYVPAEFKAPGVYDPEESLGDGIGSSYGIIGYKGGKWTIRHKGERHMFVREDDGSALNYIDVVILRAAPSKSKSYYPGKYDDEASQGKRPTCASMNGVYPDTDVQERQSNTCAICPRNEWKTDGEGRRHRDCQDYKRLAILLTPAMSKKVLGTPLVEPVFLRVPPSSLNDLQVYGDALKSRGIPYFFAVTRVSFVQEIDGKILSYPKFKFQLIGGMQPQDAPIITKLREDIQAKRITGEDQAQAAAPPQVAQAELPKVTASPAPQPQPSPQPAPAPAPQQQVAPAPTPPPKKEENFSFGSFDGAGLGATQPVIEVPNGGSPMVQAPVSAGANGNGHAVPAGDTGLPEDSDAELDALVGKMLVKPT